MTDAPVLGRSLNDVLSHVYVFVEHLNVLLAREARDAYVDGEREALNADVAHLANYNLIMKWREVLVSGRAGWSSDDDVLGLCHDVGLSPEVDERLVTCVLAMVMSPPGTLPDRIDSWKIPGGRKAEIPVLVGPIGKSHKHVREPVEHRPDSSQLFVTNANRACLLAASTLQWEEPWDALAVVRRFLEEALGYRGRRPDQIIQQWLLGQFEISYDKSTQYALAHACRRINTLFYGERSPSTQRTHTWRTPLVEVREVLSLLADSLANPDQNDTTEPVETRRKRAFAMYLFLRFCRQLRSVILWPRPNSDLEASESHASSFRQVSALYPITPSYFQCRVFGHIADVQGLSHIMRGGLLPRVQAGQVTLISGPPGAGKTTLALQLVADIARMGGLAVYFSFEENYGSVVDRLIAFNLHEGFSVERYSRDSQVIHHMKSDSGPSGKGLLLLYDESPKTFPLLAALDEVGKKAAGWRGPRALVLDSLEALAFHPDNDDPRPRAWRVKLQQVVDKIEATGFWGYLLGEEGGLGKTIMPYLADSVFHLETSSNNQMRAFEVVKCRSQDFHMGRHWFRIVDGRGVVLYPSLPSRRDSLRHRVRATLSEHRLIPFPETWRSQLGLYGVREKSVTVIKGPPGSGKSELLLWLMSEPALVRDSGQEWSKARTERPPRSTLMVTFRTSERILMQTLSRSRFLRARFAVIAKQDIRWFSPGINLTPSQLVAEIWRYVNRARRAGFKLDRVVFDETEASTSLFPSLAAEPMLWPTLLELMMSEGLTSFFAGSEDELEASTLSVLAETSTYVLRVARAAESTSVRTVEVSQCPAFLGPEESLKSSQADFVIMPSGDVGPTSPSPP